MVMNKNKIICILSIFLFVIVGCNKKENSKIYYVVGYDGECKIDTLKGTAKSGGYVFISEDLKDSLLADNRFEGEKGYYYGTFLDDCIDFPIESMLSEGRYCGFTFFPDKYRFAFKVQINSYRPMTEAEERDAARLVNASCYSPLVGYYFKPVVITSISKIK